MIRTFAPSTTKILNMSLVQLIHPSNASILQTLEFTSDRGEVP